MRWAPVSVQLILDNEKVPISNLQEIINEVAHAREVVTLPARRAEPKVVGVGCLGPAFVVEKIGDIVLEESLTSPKAAGTLKVGVVRTIWGAPSNSSANRALSAPASLTLIANPGLRRSIASTNSAHTSGQACGGVPAEERSLPTRVGPSNS